MARDVELRVRVRNDLDWSDVLADAERMEEFFYWKEFAKEQSDWNNNVADLDEYQKAEGQWTCDCNKYTGTEEEVDEHIRRSNKEIADAGYPAERLHEIVCWGRTREVL